MQLNPDKKSQFNIKKFTEKISAPPKTIPPSKSWPPRNAPMTPTQQASIAPCDRHLDYVTFHLTHPIHGNLSITRRKKQNSGKEIYFDITLTPQKNDRSQEKVLLLSCTQIMYVLNDDEIHGHQSTLGYSDIDLPPEMQNKGIGYALHFVVAQTARQIAVEKFAVDSVVTEGMQRLCDGLGMIESSGNYEATPDMIFDNAKSKCVEKGWKIQSHQ